MKERPILFSGAMVRAILEGRKAMTRRVVKPQPAPNRPYDGGTAWNYDEKTGLHRPYGTVGHLTVREKMGLFCPFGQPGDRLWVRETWEEVHPCQIDEGRFSLEGRVGIPGPPPVHYRVIYRADGEYPRLHFKEGFPYRERCQPGCVKDHIHPLEAWHGWTPSIHMPRWACRLVLEVASVRVERLQEISEEDARAEGADPYDWQYDNGEGPESYREAFRCLWDSINASRGYGWERNPWVWVVEFKRVEA